MSAEPAPLLLRQAESLGLALEPHVRSGQLLLLELDPRAPASLQAAGSKAFIEAIRAEHPSVSLIVIDPLTALTVGLVEEAPLRLLARDLIAATPHTTLVLTVETERPGSDAAVERVLAEVCGTSLALGRRKDGRRTLRVTKTRAGAGAAEAVEFRIGANGAELVREIAAEPDATSALRPPVAAAAPRSAPAARSDRGARAGRRPATPRREATRTRGPGAHPAWSIPTRRPACSSGAGSSDATGCRLRRRASRRSACWSKGNPTRSCSSSPCRA